MEFDITPFGDSALLVSFDNEISVSVNKRVVSLKNKVESAQLPSFRELIPAYQSLTIIYDSLQTDFFSFSEEIKKLTLQASDDSEEDGSIVEIPVCYDEKFSPDLKEVARVCGVTEAEVVKIHGDSLYRVYMTGFTPGFVYLGLVDPRIQVSRKANPRIRVPAGSVALADSQTGIYPLESPGGWNIIGNTPINLMEKMVSNQPLVSIGDQVRFFSISREEYFDLKQSG